MRILVVEDEARLAALLQRGLQEDGYIVDVAGTGPIGLWRATEFEYDAVVLDWMLPGLSGPAVCAELRQRGRWVPVLMLTARTAVDERIEGLDAGADDYLGKPFAYSELTARLRALLRRGAPERPPVLEIGELAIDPAARRVTISGRDLSLSAKEYAVLELMVRHRDTVMSRGRILEHAWDFAFEPSSNIVDQYIGYLRRKIAARTDTVAIVTVRSVGYRLAAADPAASPPAGGRQWRSG